MHASRILRWISKMDYSKVHDNSLSVLSLSLSLSFAGRLISFVRFLKNLLCEKQGVKDTKVT